MKIGSLCSGAGGLDMAVEQAFGARTAWHCELDPSAAKVLAHHWPDVPNHRDLTAVDWDAVEPVDILTAGYPCQPFSQSGLRKGATDERHLWPHVRQAIRRVRPRLTLLENVAGHRSLGFDRVLGDLAEDGMHVRWTSLRAADVGACHGRERLFIAVTPYASGSGLSRRPQRNIRPESRLATPRRDDADRRPLAAQRDDLKLLPTPSARDWKGGMRSVRDDAGGRRPLASADLTKARGSGGASSLPDVIEMIASWGPYEPAVRRWERLTRPAPPAAEPSSNGRPRLRPAFSEWMQGWPAGWVTAVPGLTRTQMLRIIGNGVVPQCAAAALTHLVNADERD